MPAGRRGHKIREYQRRIDAVLEAHQVSQVSTSPPISYEHAVLRNRIAEACAGMEFDPLALDWRGDSLCTLCTPETAHFAVLALGLMFEEREMLVSNGVDWRLYQSG